PPVPLNDASRSALGWTGLPANMRPDFRPGISLFSLGFADVFQGRAGDALVPPHMREGSASLWLHRDLAGVLAGDGDLGGRGACNQACVVRERHEAEAHADHARRVDPGGVVDAGELAALAGGLDQLLVDLENLRLLAVEHRLHAEREAEI